MATQAAQGKQLLAESKYIEAIEKFTQAIAATPTSPDYLIQRSIAYQRSKQYTNALQDAEAAVLHAHTRAKRESIVQAQLRRGIALFCLERYGDAKLVLDVVKSKDQKEKSVDVWLQKTQLKLKALDSEDEKSKVNITEMPDKSVIAAVHTALQNSAASTTAATPATTTAPQITPADKIRHEWYQNNTSVFFTLLVKGHPKDADIVDFTETSMNISFPIKDTGTIYDFTVDPFFALIDPAKSTVRVLPTKIEVTLVKASPGQKWSTLEGTQQFAESSSVADKPGVPQAVLAAKAPVYPTSSKSGPKDWDKIASDKTSYDEDEGGDDATKFFKQLYKGASTETQRAMMKSYTESNGTTLSTDWSEVSKRQVETVPPDGMVSKKWQS